MHMLPESIDPFYEEYYRTCKLLLSAIGLWPFERKTVSRVKNIMVGHVLVLIIVSQIIVLQNLAFSLDSFLNKVSMILAACGVGVKYFSFCLIRGNVQLLLEATTCDWRGLRTAEELEIIKKYAMRGKLQAMLFSVVLCPSSVCLMLSPFTSVVLNRIMPLNESRNVQFPILYISGLDQDQYFSFNAVGFILSLFLCAISLLSTESIFLMFCQHVCGLFAVTSHRFEKAITDAVLKHEKSNEWTCREIREAIHMHTRASSFSENMSKTFGWFYFVLIFIAISALSINLYRVTQAIILFDDFVELMTAAFFSMGILKYMFFLNYISQQMVEESIGVFAAICSTRWYKAPLSVQRLLIVILMRSMKPPNLALLGFYYPSFEGFSSIVQLSLSYCMVLFSCQQT